MIHTSASPWHVEHGGRVVVANFCRIEPEFIAEVKWGTQLQGGIHVSLNGAAISLCRLAQNRPKLTLMPVRFEQ